jgi:hypothetical protein
MQVEPQSAEHTRQVAIGPGAFWESGRSVASALAEIFSRVASIFFHPVVAASPTLMYRMLRDGETRKLAEEKLAGDHPTARRRVIERSKLTGLTGREVGIRPIASPVKRCVRSP